MRLGAGGVRRRAWRTSTGPSRTAASRWRSSRARAAGSVVGPRRAPVVDRLAPGVPVVGCASGRASRPRSSAPPLRSSWASTSSWTRSGAARRCPWPSGSRWPPRRTMPRARSSRRSRRGAPRRLTPTRSSRGRSAGCSPGTGVGWATIAAELFISPAAAAAALRRGVRLRSEDAASHPPVPGVPRARAGRRPPRNRPQPAGRHGGILRSGAPDAGLPRALGPDAGCARGGDAGELRRQPRSRRLVRRSARGARDDTVVRFVQEAAAGARLTSRRSVRTHDDHDPGGDQRRGQPGPRGRRYRGRAPRRRAHRHRRRGRTAARAARPRLGRLGPRDLPAGESRRAGTEPRSRLPPGSGGRRALGRRRGGRQPAGAAGGERAPRQRKRVGLPDALAAAAAGGEAAGGRALGLTLFATSVGAVASPLLLGPSGDLAETAGLPRLTGIYVIAGVAFLTAALALGMASGAAAWRSCGASTPWPDRHGAGCSTAPRRSRRATAWPCSQSRTS